VQVVNRYEEVGSDFVHNRVWIRRDWRSAVVMYEDVSEVKIVTTWANK
jgi:hypothetical protein